MEGAMQAQWNDGRDVRKPTFRAKKVLHRDHIETANQWSSTSPAYWSGHRNIINFLVRIWRSGDIGLKNWRPKAWWLIKSFQMILAYLALYGPPIRFQTPPHWSRHLHRLQCPGCARNFAWLDSCVTKLWDVDSKCGSDCRPSWSWRSVHVIYHWYVMIWVKDDQRCLAAFQLKILLMALLALVSARFAPRISRRIGITSAVLRSHKDNYEVRIHVPVAGLTPSKTWPPINQSINESTENSSIQKTNPTNESTGHRGIPRS